MCDDDTQTFACFTEEEERGGAGQRLQAADRVSGCAANTHTTTTTMQRQSPGRDTEELRRDEQAVA